MKKMVLLFLALFLTLSIAACSSSSELQKVTGTNSEQAQAIEKVLSDNGIELGTITKAVIENSGDNSFTNSTTDALLTKFDPYDIVSSDGAKYRMVLNKEDKTVFAITNMDSGESVYGGFGGSTLISEDSSNNESAPLIIESKSIGETGEIGNFSVTLNNIETVSEIPGNTSYSRFTPTEGTKYLVGEFTIINNGTELDTFIKSYVGPDDVSVKVIYKETYEYSVTNLLGKDTILNGESLNPLTTKTGILAFEIPDEVLNDSENPVKFVFSAGNKELVFNITPTTQNLAETTGTAAHSPTSSTTTASSNNPSVAATNEPEEEIVYEYDVNSGQSYVDRDIHF